MKTSSQSVIDLARKRGLIRPRDLAPLGLPRVTLTRLVREGALVRVGRGLYTLPDRLVSEHAALAIAARACPQGVVCLLSALRFHDITTQSPFEVWLAIPNKARVPRVDYPQLRVMRFSGQAMTEGIEERLIDGVPVKITNVEKTVVDCFKYRNKIGLDVALEALREAWKQRSVTMEELWYYARMCRVANIMRPYLEGLM